MGQECTFHYLHNLDKFPTDILIYDFINSRVSAKVAWRYAGIFIFCQPRTRTDRLHKILQNNCTASQPSFTACSPFGALFTADCSCLSHLEVAGLGLRRAVAVYGGGLGGAVLVQLPLGDLGSSEF